MRKKLTPIRYGDRFEELCGFYLSIGMTYSEYWDGDVEIVKYYRKKYEYERNRKNRELWLQGYYIYEAILDSAPALNPLSKKHEPLPYRTELIPLTREDEERLIEERNRKQMEDGKRFMEQLATRINKKFKEKEVKDGN